MDNNMEILISSEDIQKKVDELAAQIDRDYPDTNRRLVIVSVLKGALVFTADLMRAIKRPVELHVLVASSYGTGTSSTGNVKIQYHSFGDDDLKDTDILLVDDITDSGRTLLAIGQYLESYAPHSVRYCTFLNKADRREVDLAPNYIGFDIPDRFVIGYGLDYAENYRDLKDIAIITE